jgi:hypothetical protein
LIDASAATGTARAPLRYRGTADAASEPMIAIPMMSIATQDRLFSAPADRPERSLEKSTVFTSNMTLPVNRWFRYSAGFSAAWAEGVINSYQAGRGDIIVLDPFAGSGTTLIASQVAGAQAFGLESHPFVARVARAKLSWEASVEEFEMRGAQVLASAKPRSLRNPPALLAKIYPRETLARLSGLRAAVDAGQQGDEIDNLVWLALVAILRICSPVGTAQWQYVLPNKTKARTAEPMEAFARQVGMMASDMRDMPPSAAQAHVFQEDARIAGSIPDDAIDLVVTSPPYPNNYDYADATRIEMTFLGEVERWRDLQAAVRAYLIRSCSQHMIHYDPEEGFEAPEIAPIRSELRIAYERLTLERERHRGRKAYDAMVVAYFHDLARTWVMLRRVCRPGARALFIIGDSAPYAVHLPVERWLGELALGAGFNEWSFDKLRDRNIKWKNRKHRVPLHEGILTVGG